MANTEVSLTIRTASEDQERVVTVKTLASTSSLRYRDWVNRNRTYVHEKTDGQVGYIHIPDMEPNGYAEFHRSYLAEVDRQALIVDLRFNSGGFVSPLILEKLSRRRIGYRVSRWHEDPRVYPPESISGPIVALTNEQTSSDGDIFSHGFKLLQLGPLIGKRTWGGVVGYWWRQSLVDGTRTTQPESHLWFVDVGWAVENYGVEPDIEVDITPQEYSQGIDSQLDVAIKEILDLLKDSPPIIPNFGPKPDRSAPRLPDRPGTYQEKA
jgi:tricorn protease